MSPHPSFNTRSKGPKVEGQGYTVLQSAKRRWSAWPVYVTHSIECLASTVVINMIRDAN